MKIKIESDVYDIVNRIKEIDDGYYIVYNTAKMVYELHNSKQPYSYCLTIPYDEIDNRLIDLICVTNIRNIDNIIEDIDNNNDKLEKEKMNKFKDVSDYKLREIYKFESNSSKEIGDDLFENNWR